MKIVEIQLNLLQEAAWNPNEMDEATLGRLRKSISRYGLVQNLVVRPVGTERYEVLSGNQRLKVLREAGFSHAMCVVVDADDAHARLLAQALNHIHGDDDLGLRAEVVRKMLDSIEKEDILAILPGNLDGLNSLASLGQQNVVEYLQKWESARAARLRHLQFQVTAAQLDVVHEAIAMILPQADKARGDSPNTRGTALFLLSKFYLERKTNE